MACISKRESYKSASVMSGNNLEILPGTFSLNLRLYSDHFENLPVTLHLDSNKDNYCLEQHVTYRKGDYVKKA